MKKIWFIALASILLGMVSCSEDDPVEETFYTVSFDADGGTPTPEVQRVKEGEKVTAPSANPDKEGYVFLFWHLSGASTAYNFATPVTGNMTLTARYEEESAVEYWQVTWNLNGGAWTADDNHAAQVVRGGTLAEPAAPTKAGNTFEGWYKESALTNKVTFPYDVSTVAGDFTLYAKWTAEGESEEPGTFTSIATLETWLAEQAENTSETAYKVKLKGVNLDEGTNWNDLGVAVKDSSKFVDLDLSGCTGIAIPDGRTESEFVGDGFIVTRYGVFAGCSNLTEIILPSGIKTIGENAFYECENLTSISLPAELEEIRRSAFSNCSALASVSLPDGLNSIGKSAFYDCDALKSVSLPASLKIIDEHAFWECSVIESISPFPAGLDSIGVQAFADAFSKSGNISITIPGTVKNVAVGAFQLSDIDVLVLEEGVESIGEHAFEACRSLESVTLPSSLKTIGPNAFNYDSYEGEHLLKTITIPASVTFIGGDAFYMLRLEELIVLPTTPPRLASGILGYYNGDPISCIIKVPAASVDDYKRASGWNVYRDNIVANSN